MAIWHGSPDLDLLNGYASRDMTGRMGMIYTEIGDDYLRARIPVTDNWRQAYGLWHGGASCVVSESMGSVGTSLCLDSEREYCVGIEINASHMRSATGGHVTAEARPIKLGRNLHVWETRLWNDEDKLMCVSRLTTSIIAGGPPKIG